MLLLLFNTILIALLLLIVIHDFRYRAIYAWLLPVIGLCFIIKTLLIVGIDSFVVTNWGINAFIISFQFLLLVLYFGILTKRKLKKMIGLGDVLFLYTIQFALPTFYFILTCTLGYSVALLGKLIAPDKFPTIPLAGWLAITLIITLFIELIKKQTCWDWLYLL